MKVLVIKLGALGDIIMSTPAIKTLVAAHANDELCLLTSTPYAHLFLDWPGLQVQHFPRKGMLATLRSVTWLRSQRFDRIYDLQSNDRSRILCLLSATREIVGNHDRSPYTHHPGDCYTGQSHIFERHKQVLASADISLNEEKPWLPVSVEAVENVQRWINAHGLTKNRFVLMHAGTSPAHPQKRWPHFSDLAQYISAAGYDVVWIGAADDAVINARLAEKTGIDATGVFTVPELVALGFSASFAVTNDSGPMHILSCATLPVFALYGPTDWRRYHAIGQENHVISLDKSNSAWQAGDFPAGSTGQLELISAEMVWSLLSIEMHIGL